MAKRGTTLSKEEKRPLNKENFSKLLRIFSFIRPYSRLFILGLVCLLFSSSILLAFPALTGKLIDAASGDSDWILDDINSIALALLGVLFVQSIFSFLRVFLFARVSENSIADLRNSLYSKLLALPMGFYDKRRTGELFSRITSDVSQLQDTFSTTLAEFLRQILTLLVGVAIIFVTTPKLSLFMLATFPFLVILAFVFGRFIRKLSKKTQDELASANVVVEETLQSIQVVKAFASELFESMRYGRALRRVVDIAITTAVYRGLFISFIIFALFGGIVAVMWYGASLVAEGTLSVGDLLSFILYTTFIGGSIAGLGDLYGQIQKSIGASERVIEILDETAESIAPVKEKALNLRGKVSFRNVHFSYPTRVELPVLQGLDFEIKPGEKVALVGHSGAGKSTIIQLIMRFYDPVSGSILVDDRPIDEYPLSAYRQALGIVPQEITLFGGSIAENIAYGKPDASMEEIVQAAKNSYAEEFINSFPEAYQTLVGERGIKLSGGQRQRVAIARALLKDPRILILDEATSSLDAESEGFVQKALDKLMHGRTSIIIAHRLATIRKVDRIIVLEQGRIVETGTHDELMSGSSSVYNKFVSLQMHLH
jgi:ABC transporter fused permease/ATP-binding protein